MGSGIAENIAVGEGTSQNSSLPLPGGEPEFQGGKTHFQHWKSRMTRLT